MNKNLKEMRLRFKELEKIITKNYYVVYNLRNFLNNYQSEFKNKESLEALKRIAIFLEPREKEYECAKSECRELKEKMQKICNHEIIVKNEDSFYCPICYDKFYQSSPEDLFYFSTIYSATKYIIELKRKRDEDVSKVIDDALTNEGNFIENIESGLAEIQYESNVKLIRR